MTDCLWTLSRRLEVGGPSEDQLSSQSNRQYQAGNMMVKLSDLTSFTETFASTLGNLQVIQRTDNNYYWLISNVFYSYFNRAIFYQQLI